MKESTGSIAQDALLAGYQTSCQKGISVLLKSEDRTILACKDIKADAIALVKKRVAELQEEENNWTDPYMEEIKKFNIFKQAYLSWMYKPIPHVIRDIIHKDVELSISDGYWYCDIDRLEANGKVTGMEVCRLKGKFGSVEYDNFRTYSKAIIPDDVLETIKEAQDIGMENIQIAYPIMSDGLLPNDDPYVVGYIKDKDTKESEMFIIAQFGFKEVKK